MISSKELTSQQERRSCRFLFDVAVDLGILSHLIPDINSRFGLAPEHVSVYDPKLKQFIGMNYVNAVLNFQVL